MTDIRDRKRAFFVVFGSFVVCALACAWFLSSWPIVLASVLAAGALIDFEVGVKLLYPYLAFLSVLAASVALIQLGLSFFVVCLCSSVFLILVIYTCYFYDQHVLQRRYPDAQ